MIKNIWPLAVALAFTAGCATQEEAPAPAPTQAPAPAPAPEPMAKPAPEPMKPTPAPMAEKPKPKPMAEKLTLSTNVLFDFDKATIRPAARTELDNLLFSIGGMDLEVVIAIGHADMIGPSGYNQRLSTRRADAIKDYLVSRGVEENRIYTEGKGETQPVTEGGCKGSGAQLIECLQPDRRTEIEVIGTRR